jgi:hypothetical protein
VQIQVLSKSKFYPSVLLGAQKFMKGKELHTDLFQIKSNFFQSSTCIQPASVPCRSFFFKKKELAGIYWLSTSSCSYQKWQKTCFEPQKQGFQKIKLEKSLSPKLPILASTKLPAL